MAGPDWSSRLRSSKGFRATKTMPLLGELVKPLIERPGKAMELATSGWARAMSPMRRMTESVRSSEAPSGSWAKAMRYCLSWTGTKPAGVLSNITPEKPTSAT